MSSERQSMDIQAFVLDAATDTEGIFRYQPGSSFLHRLHPITKLVMATGLVLSVFLIGDFRVPIVLTVIVFGIVALAGLARKVLPVVGAIGVPLGTTILLIHGMFYPGRETVFVTLGPVPVVGRIQFWNEGIAFALLITFRIVVMLIALLAIILSTHPRELTIALMDKGMPHKLAYVFLAALQFIPDMRDRAFSILDAQQARGLDTNANLYRRLKAFVELMAPLLIGTLIATETRALALESRGFARTDELTSLFEVEETLVDRLLQGITVVAVLAVAAWAVVL